MRHIIIVNSNARTIYKNLKFQKLSIYRLQKKKLNTIILYFIIFIYCKFNKSQIFVGRKFNNYNL